jgi:hypothetical protein
MTTANIGQNILLAKSIFTLDVEHIQVQSEQRF